MDCDWSAKGSNLVEKPTYSDMVATKTAPDSLTPVNATSNPEIFEHKPDVPVTTEALLEMKINAGFAEDDCQMTESSTNDSANEEKRRFIRQSKKVKRLRRKQHYSKFIKPKNALMSLHELLGTAFLEFNILPEEHGFVASVYVNGVHYEGRGPSKIASKNNAAEWALREIMIRRMVQSSESQEPKPSEESAQQGGEQITEDDSSSVKDKKGKESDGDTAMLHLASFALFKLFSEWQADGFEIPGFKTAAETRPDKAIIPKVPPKRTHLPENAHDIHPTRLLCIMRPQTKYIDLGNAGQAPNILYYVGVEVDGSPFIASAKNKKLARKYVAIDACNQSFGTFFVKDEN